MPRASWRGYLRLSLVSCPIYLSPATAPAKPIRRSRGYQAGRARTVLGKHWRTRLTPAFYPQLDHQIMGWTTAADAVTVARLLLEKDASGVTSDLHRRTGWEKRRFNPAFGMVLERLPECRISHEFQPDYPSPYVLVLSEDRAALKRFIAAVEGT